MNPRESHEPLGGLGQKVDMPEPPKDAVQVAPGIFRGADGKLFTEIPPPPAQPIPYP